jgi:putative intracellular protease/amidase
MYPVLRRIARVVAVVVAVLLLPAVGAAVSAVMTFDALYAPGPDRPVPAAPPVAHDPMKPTAVVVVGDRGAVVSDVLAPYEILAATGRFNLYTVAPQRGHVPLTGGLDLVPDLTFDELAVRTGAVAPDLVVVPALADEGEPSMARVTDWLRQQADRGAQLLGVCNGAGALAAAGRSSGGPPPRTGCGSVATRGGTRRCAGCAGSATSTTATSSAPPASCPGSTAPCTWSSGWPDRPSLPRPPRPWDGGTTAPTRP